jgi:hypothetical protein
VVFQGHAMNRNRDPQQADFDEEAPPPGELFRDLVAWPAATGCPTSDSRSKVNHTTLPASSVSAPQDLASASTITMPRPVVAVSEYCLTKGVALLVSRHSALRPASVRTSRSSALLPL